MRYVWDMFCEYLFLPQLCYMILASFHVVVLYRFVLTLPSINLGEKYSVLQNPSGEPNTFHPNLLKAVLIQNGTGLQHEMMLKSYSKAGEEIDTHRTYPKRIALTLQNGLPLTIASSDSGISLLPTGLTLYDENNLPVYLMRQDGTSWAIDVPEGIYNVEVKAEYTP